MVWKSVIGVLAILAGALIVAARRRRPNEPSLGAVSTTWIAEHQSGVDV